MNQVKNLEETESEDALDRLGITRRLAKALRAWDGMTEEQRLGVDGKATSAEIRDIGEFAAHFGGTVALERLDASMHRAGKLNYKLNTMWSGIAEWAA